MKNNKMFKSSMLITATMLVLVSCGGGNKTEVGFKVTDKNKDNYTIDSVFDNDNGIEATAVYSDGSQMAIPKGNYSYSVSLNNQKVDTSKAFGKIGTYTCVVTYKDTFDPVIYNFIINNEQKEVTKIEIASSAKKTTFSIGEVFSSEGLQLKVTYSDGSTAQVSSGFTTNYDDHAFAASEVGSKTVTVTYAKKTVTYSITVQEVKKEVEKIEISTSASKTEFGVGDTFSSSGLKLKVTYKDSSTSIIGSGYTTNYDGHKFIASDVGSKTVTVTYSAKTTTYEITVKDVTPIGDYSYKFNKKIFDSDGDYSLNNISWNLSSGVTSFDYDSSTYDRGQQIGSSGNPAFTVTLSTKGFSSSIKKIVVGTSGGKSVACTFSVSVGGSAFGSTFAITQSNVEYTFEGSASGEIVFTWNQSSSKALFIKSIYVEFDSTPIPATDITVNPSSLELTLGKTKALSINYTPSGATTEKDVTWKSSNPDVISVDTNGVVSTSSNAKVGDTAVITATLVTNQKTSTCSVTVVEQKKDAYTVMVYMSGNDLESATYQGGCATADIDEMLAATGQPDDVNVIIQTGGCKKWQKYSISNNKLGRYHIENNQFKKDTELTNASMGESSTFQSFIEWGINEYPADKMSVVMWNHGGAMQGVCFDELYEGPIYTQDSLQGDEICEAMKNAFANTGFTGKFEWIGYDACLMGVQDNATINSDYFNYMISSQETEGGGGWYYTTWLNSLFKNPSISTYDLGKQIVDSFGAYSYQDWTLSVLDLSKVDSFVTAFDSLTNQIASIIGTSESIWENLVTVLNSSLQFGADSSGNYSYDIFDTKSFLSNLSSSATFKTCDITGVSSAIDQMVIYNKHGSDYSTTKQPCGLCTFAAVSGEHLKEQYTQNNTKLTSWRDLQIKFGNWYSW